MRQRKCLQACERTLWMTAVIIISFPGIRQAAAFGSCSSIKLRGPSLVASHAGKSEYVLCDGIQVKEHCPECLPTNSDICWSSNTSTTEALKHRPRPNRLVGGTT